MLDTKAVLQRAISRISDATWEVNIQSPRYLIPSSQPSPEGRRRY